MLQRFLRAFRRRGHSTGFDHYFMRLQRTGLTGLPSLDEARRDYRAAMRDSDFRV